MDFTGQPDAPAADGPWSDYTAQPAAPAAAAPSSAQAAPAGPWADYAPAPQNAGRDTLGGYLLPAGADQQQHAASAAPGLEPTMLDKATDTAAGAFTLVGRPVGAAVTAAIGSGGTFGDRYHAAREQQDANDASLPWYVRYPAEIVGGIADPIVMGAAKGAGALYDMLPGAGALVGAGRVGQVAGTALRSATEGAAAGGVMAAPEADYRGGAANALAQIGTGAATGAVLAPAANALFAAAGKAGTFLSEAGIGRKNALLPDVASDVRATRGVADAAGRQIAEAASDPAAVQAATAQPAVVVPGSLPTTFQQTGDTGLGQLERGLRQAPGSSQPFIDRANEQNAARVSAIGGTAPAASTTSDLVESLTAQRDALAARHAEAQHAASQGTLQDIGGASSNTPTQAGTTLRAAVNTARAPAVAEADQAVAAGQGQLQGALNQLGGVPAGDSGSALQQYGQGFRSTLATNKAAAKGSAGALFDALAENKSLALPIAPVQQARQRILADVGSVSKPPSGEEAAIYDAVAKMPPVSSFSDLRDLNTRIGNALRAERSSPSGDQQAIRRLGQLQGSIHDSIEGASNLVDVPGASAQSASSASRPVAASLDSRLDALDTELRSGQVSDPDLHNALSVATGPAGISPGRGGLIERVMDWALANGRRDIADTIIGRAERAAAAARGETPAIPPDHPSYAGVQAYIARNADETAAYAAGLRERAGGGDADAGRATAAPAGQGGATTASPSAAPAVGDAVYTPSGQRVGVRYELADAGDLVASHGADMTPNPAYPAELQPRDRSRAASQLQVQQMAGQLEPARLGASSSVADGAPIVGPDGVVESGNGRVAAIRQAYQQGGRSADAYRAWLENAGHDTTGMAQPVLIRRRTTDLTPGARQQFTAEGNTPTTLAMSATEKAAGDAGRLTPDVLGALQPGDVTAPGNRGFVRSYLRQVVEPGQEGAFVGADGSLSQEGAARVRAALNHKAYGDAGLTASLAESTDPHAKVLAGAMQDAAPAMAKLRAGIERGEVDSAVDIAPSLVEAARVVQSARQRGISLADAVAQQDAFNPVSPQATGLLKMAYGEALSGRMSREAFADSLGLYAQRAAEQHAGGSLFGPNLTAEQLLDGTTGRYGRSAAQAGASSESTGFAGAGSVSQGDRGRGFVPDATGPADAGGRGGAGPRGAGSRVLPTADAGQPPLSSSFTGADAQRYADARAAYRDMKERFDRAPGVGQVLRSGPMAGSFTMPDSNVPAALFSGGKGAAERVQAAMRGGILPHELTDYAAHDLRLNAGTADGGIDPARAARWRAKNAEALDALGRVDPQARGAFDGVQQMAQRVADLQTARKALDVAHPLADSLGGAEVMAKVVAKGPGGADKLRRVLDAADNSPDAVQAAGDYLAHQLRADAAPNGVIDPRKYAAFVRSYDGALSVRPEIRAQFDTAVKAQATLNDAAARHADNLVDYQRSAAASLLNNVPPERAVGAILGKPTALPQMQQLARLTENDPAARAGLQRAVVEHIQQQFGGNSLAGQTGTTVLRSNQLQDFLRSNNAALRAVMTPQQVDMMGKVAADLQRSNLSNAGTKAAVGSDTQQNRGAVESLLGMAVRAGVGKSIGVVAGLFHGGWGGALAGEKLGAVADQLAAQFRAAGIKETSDLVTRAMLDPALANVLLARVTDKSRPNVAKALGAVLGRTVAANAGAGLVSAEGRR